MKERDIEKAYSKDEFVSKLRRLADCIEKNENFDTSIILEFLCSKLEKWYLKLKWTISIRLLVKYC